jgi:protein-S-isoprenylcysteine O-methyltransferase Ste14
MTALFAAVRTLVVATVFFWLWTIVGLWARQFDPIFGGPLPSWTWPIGVLLASSGAALALTCAGLFALRGKGTPAPFDPPRTLVAFGPYRAIRNPMYVGGWLLIAGFALIARSSSVLAVSFTFLVLAHLFVILYEEPTLASKFGPAYEAYRRAVPRWMPKLASW